MLLTWLGYSLSLEGWCLWRDYDVTLGQLMSPLHPYNGPWPPARIPDTQIWPGGTTAAPATTQKPNPTGAAGQITNVAGGVVGPNWWKKILGGVVGGGSL